MLKTVGDVCPSVDLFAVGGRLSEPQNAMILAGDERLAHALHGSKLCQRQRPVEDRQRLCATRPMACGRRGVRRQSRIPWDAIIARGLMLD